MTPRSLLAPARLAGRSVLGTQSDERLVDLARAGSEPAFEAIVARYRHPLLGYCRRLLGEERAEDAVQQTFVKAHAALTGGQAELRLRPWLYRVAHNAALNLLRDRALRHEPLDEGMDGVEPPDQAAERRQGLRDVLSAVQALPVRQRNAIVLRELEGRSYEEIAGQLGVSGGAVRMLLNRARNSLRAGATAVTPVGLLLRLPAPIADVPTAARVAELCAAGGAGAVAAKVCATALVTGAVAGGVAVTPDGGRDQPAPARAEPGRAAPRATPSETTREAVPPSTGRRREEDRRDDRDRSGKSESSGPGPGDRAVPDSPDNSGPGSDNSGPGSGSSGPGSGDELLMGLKDSSGPGSGGGSSGSGGSGSGSDNSGPG